MTRFVRSAVIYGIGVLKGPMHRKVKARTWQRSEYTGRYEAVEIDAYKPLFDFLPVWSYYPDLTATSLKHQDGVFERHIMTRAQVQELAERPDFLEDRIGEYLKKNPDGNYKEQWWESSIKSEPKSAQASVSGKAVRKYEVLSFWGSATGEEIASAGNAVREADRGKVFHANIWMIDDVVIKAKLAPLGDAIRHHHEFVFEEDDLSIVGSGLPETLRDSQMSLAEAVRAALDDSSVTGPMAGIDSEYLTPGQNTGISKHKTWLFENLPTGKTIQSVFAGLNVDSHLAESLQLIQLFLSLGEKESGLPPSASSIS